MIKIDGNYTDFRDDTDEKYPYGKAVAASTVHRGALRCLMICTEQGRQFSKKRLTEQSAHLPISRIISKIRTCWTLF